MKDVPVLRTFRIGREGLVLGRDALGAADDRISRLHSRLRMHGGGAWISDLGSRNGTFVDGAATPLDGEVGLVDRAVVRIGATLALYVADVRPYEEAEIDQGPLAIIGPVLADVWRAAETAARVGDTLLVTGESGSGKELVARAFHAASGAKGELVAINAAAIPASMAERLLFGTRRGAYSGADRDAEGYLAAADGGTLFLDELAELDLDVQGKLLRVIESRELLPLGAVRPQAVRFNLVGATLKDLRAEVAANRFRGDLYYRIGRPAVVVPALRERREEIPFLVAREAAAAGVQAHASFVEACLVRPWPGNVRELIGEVRHLARSSAERGQRVLKAEALAAEAGAVVEPQGGDAQLVSTVERHAPAAVLPGLDAVREALAGAAGNVAAAARRLKVHRNQLRRLLKQHPELIGPSEQA